MASIIGYNIKFILSLQFVSVLFLVFFTVLVFYPSVFHCLLITETAHLRFL